MERHRLKTVMILILALMNGFLLIHLARMHTLEAAATRRAREQLAALFSAQGIDLSPGVLARREPPEGFQADWQDSPEDSLAAFFLPAGYETREEEGARVCTDGSVTVRFTGEGRFAVTGLEAEGLSLCRRFCQQFGFRPPAAMPASSPAESADNSSSGSGESALAPVRSSASGSTLGGTSPDSTPEPLPDSIYEAPALYGRREVCNCQAAFTFTEGKLRAASGVLLPRRAAPAARDTPLLNTAAALSAFLSSPRERAVSAVFRIEPCYALRTGEKPALDPVWCLATDGGAYYVNCVDGSVFLP